MKKPKEVWAEDLPLGCPTDEAKNPEPCTVMRLAKLPKPTVKCFESYAASGNTKNADTDECTFASCSTFLKNVNHDLISAIRALPKFKKYYTHVFFVEIDQGSGRARINKKSKHVDLWMYENFDPVAATVHIEALP